MEYKFPVINNLSEILHVIEEGKEHGFQIFDRGDYLVANYMFNMPETFPQVGIDPSAKIRREFRGLIFNKEGKVISRPYHKFFNLNEKGETQEHLIDFSKPHVILEKLDGSMIRPIPLPDDMFRLATKAGFTAIGDQANEFIADKANYCNFIADMIGHDVTPIFEWCSRKQRIVVDYPEDRLVLTAIRYNINGKYIPYKTVKEIAGMYDVEVVVGYSSTISKNYGMTALEFMKHQQKTSSGEEGWVIRFDDGHMLKVKADWYCARHKSKDAITYEKNVVEMIVNEAVDDIKATLTQDDRDRLDKFTTAFWNGLNDYSDQLHDKIIRKLNENGFAPRATYAEIVKSSNDLNGYERAIAFSAFEEASLENVISRVLQVVKKNMGTQKKIDEIRFMWGNHAWNYVFENDN